MAQEDLRAKIGFVPQRAVLFSGTIAENIRYGKDDATDEELRHAADDRAGRRIHRPTCRTGFDAQIAQGGTNVSGGQKQRLSIARALVRRPEIYIFDDSFSALDFTTDARLRAALKRETTDATVFIVAQRVSTIMDADRIIVLDEGRVVGIGTHRELLETCEVYREIVARSSRWRRSHERDRAAPAARRPRQAGHGSWPDGRRRADGLAIGMPVREGQGLQGHALPPAGLLAPRRSGSLIVVLVAAILSTRLHHRRPEDPGPGDHRALRGRAWRSCSGMPGAGIDFGYIGQHPDRCSASST